MSIQARMHETTLTAGTSSFVTNEIQRIDINTTVVNAQQVFLLFKSRFTLIMLFCK